LRFLLVHAHPMLRSGGRPLVPANVKDQLLLWDRERRRVVMDEVRVWCCHCFQICCVTITQLTHSLHQICCI
jgi:hypothetical protein